MTLPFLQEILVKAFQTPSEPKTGPTGGCGRAYVILCDKLDRKSVRVVSETCKAHGLMFLPKAYGTAGNAIYVGYDNADGRALARSKTIAKVLTDHGVRCYDDAVAD